MRLQKSILRIKSIQNQKKMKVSIQCYIMLLLPIIGFLVFTIYPILWTFKWSMFSYNGIESSKVFIGLENFKTMFTHDFTYWKVWLNTLLFTVCKIPLEMILAMILAIFLNKGGHTSNFFRSIFYLPNVVSVVIIGLIFSNLFSYFGLVNASLIKIGIISSEIEWFSTKLGAYAIMLIASIWNTFGVNVMYLLAALTNVSDDVYEAAKIDGATGINAFFKITLPLIAPVFQTVLLLSLIGTLGVNEFILVLTGGGPGGKTFTVMSYLTKQFVPGFTESATPAIGYGCAMSVITTILFGVVAVLYNQFSKKMNDIY